MTRVQVSAFRVDDAECDRCNGLALDIILATRDMRLCQRHLSRLRELLKANSAVEVLYDVEQE